jgi:multidrug efflux pump subunit AcrA (membrane-fusion protein)
MLGLLAATALTLVLLIGLMALWWTSLNKRLETARRTPPVAPPVAVLPARAERWPRALVLPAALQPRVTERVPAPAAGRVSRVMVRPGQRVEAGQVVAQITVSGRFTGAPGALARPRPASRRPATSGDTARKVVLAQAWQRLAQAQQASHAANLALAAAREARAQAAARRDALDRQAGEAERRFARVAARSKRSEVASRPAATFYIAGSDWRPGYDSDRPFPGVVQRHPDRLSTEAHDARASATAARAAVARTDDAVRAARRQCERVEAAIRAARSTAVRQQAAPAPARPTRERRPALPTRVEARATSEGVVAGVMAGPGTTITPGQTLMQLARSTETQYRIEGSAGVLGGLPAGAPARLHLRGATLPARVLAVRTLEGDRCVVDVAAIGPDARSVDGSGARVEVNVRALAPVVTVPLPAVVQTGERTAVWVAERQENAPATWTAHRRLVRLGATRGGKVAVAAGLEVGQSVIVAGMEQLRDGQPVAAVPWNLP